ncbi:hypothetical protein BJY59DRAFT_689575 [Rhodotorula toruloides]
MGSAARRSPARSLSGRRQSCASAPRSLRQGDAHALRDPSSLGTTDPSISPALLTVTAVGPPFQDHNQTGEWRPAVQRSEPWSEWTTVAAEERVGGTRVNCAAEEGETANGGGEQASKGVCRCRCGREPVHQSGPAEAGLALEGAGGRLDDGWLVCSATSRARRRSRRQSRLVLWRHSERSLRSSRPSLVRSARPTSTPALSARPTTSPPLPMSPPTLRQTPSSSAHRPATASTASRRLASTRRWTNLTMTSAAWTSGSSMTFPLSSLSANRAS